MSSTLIFDATLDEAELEARAFEFVAEIDYPAVIFFDGELGAGKTTFVRAMLRALGVTGAVKSPTYTLVETYETTAGTVQHFDLYRLLDPGELEFIGLRDLLSTAQLVLIEWPDKGAELLPACDWQVVLSHAEERRRLQIKCCSASSGGC